MRWTGGLSKSQRVVVVIALGLALATLGGYLVNLVSPFESGWYAYAPLASGPIIANAGIHPWLRVIIWLALIGVWALGSVWVLRPAPEDASSK
jgi:uncharacterized membrane protein